MKTSERLAVFAVLICTIVVGLSAWRTEPRAEDVGYYRRLWQEARARRRVDSVDVVKYVVRTKTSSDTVLERITDTAYIRRYVYQTDTLREKCLACIASAAALEHTADTVIVKVGANERRWYDRVGVNTGYGVLLDRGGSVRHGLTVSASVRIWP